MDLARSFNEEAVIKFFSSYKASKSCGPDGIHVLIIKALLQSMLMKHLTLLYQLCATVGLTPRPGTQ